MARCLHWPATWRRWALLVATPLLLASSLFGQTSSGSVEGRVQNVVSGDYLNNVRVSVVGSNRETFTDSTGAYQIANLPAGTQTLRFSYTGLEIKDLSVAIPPGASVRQDVGLTNSARYATDSATVRLDPLTVAATREMDATSLAINEQRFAANIKSVVAADAFGDVSEGNVGEFIKRFAGVSVNYAAGDAYSISLRGFAPEFTPITIDGGDVPSASFSATSVSRGSNLEQVSMSNVSRVEIIKSPIPSVSADSLGGSVNLVSRSAFERSKPELTFRGTLQFTSDDYSWSKTSRPGSPPTRKLRPGYEFSYVNPVNSKFGFTLSSLSSDQFGTLLSGPSRAWETLTAQGGSETAPYLRPLTIQDDPRETKRVSYAASADWRPMDGLTLSAGFRHNIYDLLTAPQRVAFNTGNAPASYSANHTQGRAGQGTIVHQQIWTTKYGNTDTFTLSGRYDRNGWKGDFRASYADSGNKYRDKEQGFFRGATTRVTAGALRYEGIDPPNMPATVELRNAAGAVVDWKRLENYQLVSVPSVERDALDEITSGAFNLRRDIKLGRNYGAIQVGGSYRKREVDRDARDETRTFVGADGVALTADDTAAPFVDPTYRQVGKYGVPEDIQWPDLRALYQLYLDRPQYFTFPLAAQTASYIFDAQNSERIQEQITAGYVQGEMKCFENRLNVLGGVRFEHTENSGVGLLRDRAAAYQRDAAGNIVRAANGTPVLIADTLERAKREYIKRGMTAGRSYSDYYPSLNLTYTVLPDLLLRFSAARTLGRPNFANVVPNIDVIEDVNSDGTIGQVNARNPALLPWTGKNYEATLEYYFKSSGVASVSVFRKDITNGFGTRLVILDEALLAQYELPNDYLGWDLMSTFNIGELVKITGFELNYQQQLTFLPGWAKGFTVFGNGTKLDLEGPEGAFSTIDDLTANWGLSYSRGRFGLGLNWNYRSSRTTPVTNLGTGGVSYNPSICTLDLNSEVRLKPRLSLFFNARNLTNAPNATYRFSSQTPEYSHLSVYTLSGVKMSAGIRGRF